MSFFELVEQPTSIGTKLNGDSDKATTEKKETDEKKEGTGSILGNIGLKMDQYAKQVCIAYYMSRCYHICFL